MSGSGANKFTLKKKKFPLVTFIHAKIWSECHWQESMEMPAAIKWAGLGTSKYEKGQGQLRLDYQCMNDRRVSKCCFLPFNLKKTFTFYEQLTFSKILKNCSYFWIHNKVKNAEKKNV